MSKRFTDAAKWRKKWFRTLPIQAKLVWIYLCDECDFAGVIKPDYELASFQVGFDFDEKNLIEWFGEKIYFIDDESLILLPFFEFQYGQSKDSWSAKIKAKIALKKLGFDVIENKVLPSSSVVVPQSPHSPPTVVPLSPSFDTTVPPQSPHSDPTRLIKGEGIGIGIGKEVSTSLKNSNATQRFELSFQYAEWLAFLRKNNLYEKRLHDGVVEVAQRFEKIDALQKFLEEVLSGEKCKTMSPAEVKKYLKGAIARECGLGKTG